MATSHAFTMLSPDDWEESRERNRRRFAERRGFEPPVPPQLAAETPEDIRRRYARIAAAHDSLRADLVAARPTTLVIVGDDQNENLSSDNLPQIAVYVGKRFETRTLNAIPGREFDVNRPFAERLLATGVRCGFDIASLGAFEKGTLRSHAHVQVLQWFASGKPLKVVLVFLNAIHQPAPEPARCFALGELIADVVRDSPEDERIAICGSGGMSHFTAGYPWKHYRGDFTYGCISEAFDRRLIDGLAGGKSRAFTALSSDDLLANGEIEFRSWIAVTGAMSGAPPSRVVYEPFYSAIMGMAVASWSERRA